MRTQFPGAPTDSRREYGGPVGTPGQDRLVRTPDGYQRVQAGPEVHEVPREASDARGGARPPAPPPELTRADFGAPQAAPVVSTAAPASTFDMNTLIALGGRPTGGGGGVSTKEYDAIQKDKQAALTAQGVEEEKGYNEIARLKREGVEQEQAYLAQQKERAAYQQKTMDDIQGQYAAAVKDLQTPSGQLDPNRWWASRDTGQKIAAFTSAFLAGFSGRPDAIQQEIDADIATQKYNFERQDRAKAARLDGMKTLFSMNMDRFKDENLASAATRAQAAEIVVHQVESVIAGIKGASARPQAQLALAAAKEDALKYKNQLAQVSAAQADKQWQRNFEIAKFQMEYGLKNAALDAKGVKGAGLKPIEQSEAVKLGTYDGAMRQIDDLDKAFHANIGAFSGLTQFLPGTSATKYVDQLKSAAQAIGYIMEGGKLTESDLSRYMDMLPQPGDGADRARAKIVNLKKIMEARRQDSINGLKDGNVDVANFEKRNAKPAEYTPDRKPAS